MASVFPVSDIENAVQSAFASEGISPGAPISASTLEKAVSQSIIRALESSAFENFVQGIAKDTPL